MNREELVEVIAEWARNEPIVKEAYLFGSREREDHKPDSDVDIAIGIIGRPGDLGEYGTWVSHEHRLKKQLRALLPYKLHLQWYDPEKTKYIHQGLLESSIKAYEQ